ncbi:glycoside hydrolase superfamily [Lipomyces doorenjongii]|uniref:glycoside hydrolase superfamily n=1 Tax=Lipomyces doorenjongii TaxID=383834 RepID=UPI0034CD6865
MSITEGLPVHRTWWKESNDFNCDGIGDIPGIVSELDYIAGLGVDIVWLCPCYKSPQVDMGYDISDYKDIHEQYGTLSDIDDLISGLHNRGLKLVMDLVVNHTSDKHQWFQSAISSRNSPYRDWYIWKNPKYAADGSHLPPNNWSSSFAGSAWEYDEKSDEYYLHLYAKEQPDLNRENPKVREAVHDVVRFWLDRGVDGFRLDVINQISKDPAMPDAPITNPAAKYQPGNMFFSSGPRLHDVGEMPRVYDLTKIIKAVGFERNELNMIIQFEIVNLDHGLTGRFTPRTWALTELKEIVNKWETFMQVNDGWNAIYPENHDQARSVSRFASDVPNVRRVAAQINIESLNNYAENVAAGASQEVLASILSEMQKKARDNARTPMQWDQTTYAGFSSVVPWMDWNTKAQVNDACSVYAYWQSVFRLRKEFKDILVYGTFSLVDALNESVFAYKRTYGSSDALIVTLFKDTETKWAVPEEYVKPGKILLSNYDIIDIAGEIVLRPFESFLLF